MPVEFDPPNDAEWLDPGPGLRFEGRGIAFADEELIWTPSAGAGEVSIELWVVPAGEPDDRLGQIFAFFDGSEREPLLVAQWKSGLVIRNRVFDGGAGSRYRELGALGRLFRDQPRYIAVASGASGTRVYLDGVATEQRSNIPVIEPGEAFGGRLVLGNSPTGTAPWSGDLLGVAVYRRTLDAADVARHAAVVGADGVASLAEESGLVALYPFEERQGEAARSRAAAGPRLRVPLGFERLRLPVLQRPDLRGLSADAYGRDALVNLLGFTPLGFFAAAVARRRGMGTGPAIAVAVVLGLSLSLGIELVQVHLPARVSSATDLVSNGLGASLGSWLALRGPIAARFFGSCAAG